MKKKLLLLIIVMTIISRTFVSAQTSTRNWQTTNADYNNPVSSTMFSWNSRDTTSSYFVKPLADTVEIYYKGSLVYATAWTRGVDYKKNNSDKDFLELHIYIPKNKETAEKTFFFDKGIELRKLTSDVNEEDVFQVKIYQNEFLFEFKNGDYGRYVDSIFNRFKKITP